MDSTRAHPRYAVEIDAEIRLGEIVLPARTCNVSRGGLCVAASRPLTVGEVVTVSMALIFDDRAMSEPLPLRGRIVWCTRTAVGQHQLGVTFLGLTGEQRAYLELFLRYLKDD